MVDHALLDPPFAEHVDEGNAAERVRDPGAFGFKAADQQLRQRTARVLADKVRRWSLIFCSFEEIHLWRQALDDVHLRCVRVGVWHKIGAKPQMSGDRPAQSNEAIIIAHNPHVALRWNSGGKGSSWMCPVPRGDDRTHPTQKPTKLLSELIHDFTDPGETIVDPFAGVASTGVAALGADRRFLGFELDPHWHAIGQQRLTQPLFDRVQQSQADFFVDPTTTPRSKKIERAQLDSDILAVLRDCNGSGLQPLQIAESLGRDERSIRDALQRMHKQQIVQREGRTRTTKYFFVPRTT